MVGYVDMQRAILFCILFLACSKNPGQALTTGNANNTGGACSTELDCPANMWCLDQRCSERNTPETPPGDVELAALAATPESLNFGSVTPPAVRTLALILDNVGARMVTLTRVHVLPEGSSFRIEPLGYGPFWIRPGRSREVFVTFAPTDSTHRAASLLIESEAPTQTVTLLGN